MRTFSIPLALALLCLTGCVRHYNITLNNNNIITSRGRPKLNPAKDSYDFTDSQGRRISIPAIKVREIAPQ